MKNLLTFQIELFLKRKFVVIYPHTEDVDISINRIIDYSKTNKDFLIYIGQEIIPFQEYFDKIKNLVQSLPNNIWIMGSTASTHPILVEPQVNLLMMKDWKPAPLKNEIYELGFPPPLYESKSWKDKTFHSILSMNRKTEWRDLIWDKVKNIPIDIKRYIGDGNKDNYPTWKELTSEYLRTYIALVIETHYNTETSFTCFTEKSVLAFLCGNIPLILGRRGLIRELESIGFWVANNDFGFGNADDIENGDESKIDEYIDCIKKINNINIEEYYIDNIDKITKNHNIISEIISKKLQKNLV